MKTMAQTNDSQLIKKKHPPAFTDSLFTIKPCSMEDRYAQFFLELDEYDSL